MGVPFREHPKIPIAWEHWRVKKRVQAWEAVFLSFGINPKDNSNIRWQDFDNCPNETQTQINNRIELLDDYKVDEEFFSYGEDGNHTRTNIYLLREFAACCVHINFPDLPPELVEMTQKPKIQNVAQSTNSQIKPLQRQPHQEQEILQVIGELGYKANALPKNLQGQKGVKAAVRAKLNYSISVFDKAWERLRSRGEILDAQ